MSEFDNALFEIEFLSGPRDGEIVRIEMPDAVVGRDSDVAVSVAADLALSPQHLKIHCQQNEISIESIDEKLDSFINEKTFQGKSVVSETDVVRTGNTEFACRLMCQTDLPTTQFAAQIESGNG